MQYFHQVFTLPAAIADIAYQNKAVIYDLLFKASAETMLIIGADPEHLGARIGFISVLHTWGSAMTHHPHVHMIAPGGGLSPDGTRWIPCRRGFFLPVLVLSALFRRLMLEKLAAAHKAGKLRFFGEHAHLASADAFAAFLAPLKKTKWFVYSKRPFSGPKTVLAYLSRYTHRVAISNRRLIAADKTGVTFKYKDYRIEGPGRYKTMTLETGEFIRRFLTHVLPKGFHRIRHYGLLASGARADNLATMRILLAMDGAGLQTRKMLARPMRPRAVAGPHSAPAAAAACSSSRPSREAAAGARPAPAPPGSTRHEQDRERFHPNAARLRRRFQAGHGGACPAASQRARSGLNAGLLAGRRKSRSPAVAPLRASAA